ncbi:ArnT family glycosyltransferase [Prevotella sp. OH937_COT-195]|uniref:ArnT family glycosyltransferase n=1 Tax=Prevotella sp. OH937_COT-195 TaxID=2491051 RepID=UPI000F64ECAC|nr:glycosyltransferase family 39 protein [Prevotella sp. OH937_COT-195]RRD02591.1 dolichyl-phosphate-mannose--protein mannosyltransferase [Prevotella sp. OH937_COT-195]
MKSRKTMLAAVVAICAAMLITFLPLTEYNSKGEPREAIVAVTMLKTGNWILPVNNGGDIAYKPPLFHWTAALCSLPQGYVSEATSRLPSALSLTAMIGLMFWFYSKRRDNSTAFLAAMLTLTSFEVYRSGVNCRVDMLLTMFIVFAIMLLYKWIEGGCRGIPLWAVLFMSGAVLTKGPVGIILPCGVAGTFLLLRGRNVKEGTTGKEQCTVSCHSLSCSSLLRPFSILLLSSVLALILPLCWYFAAYRQGGDEFLALVYEENVLRMLGKMSYESHVHNVFYNFQTLMTGWLPWILLPLVSLFFLRKKHFTYARRFIDKPCGWLARLRNMEPLELYTWVAFIIVVAFYCIPKSKRSVYLLPAYPFMAWLLAEWITRIARRKPLAVKIFSGIMGVMALLLGTVCAALQFHLVAPDSFHGRHAWQNRQIFAALQDIGFTPVSILLMLVPIVAGIYVIVKLARSSSRGTASTVDTSKAKVGNNAHYLSLIPVTAIYVCLYGLLLPAIQNVKSDRPLAMEISKTLPVDHLYSFVEEPMMHFFGTNFYLGDRIKQFEKSSPCHGFLMIADGDRTAFFARHTEYKFVEVNRTEHPATELKQIIYFYKFTAR